MVCFPVNPIASVACGENEIGASLYANYFHRIGLNPESLHLRDTSCSGTVVGQMLIFNSSATDCGTIAVRIFKSTICINGYYP